MDAERVARFIRRYGPHVVGVILYLAAIALVIAYAIWVTRTSM